MKLWIGGEIEADIADEFRAARSEVEGRVNIAIANRDYDVALEGWDCIAIVRNDSVFPEVVKYSPSERDMDFRLVVDHGEFKAADDRKRRAMICDMLLRSLALLERKAVPVGDMRKDFLEVMERNGWS